MKLLFSKTCLLILLLALSLASCKKWLDVSPKTQLKESEQFSNRQGFIDALFGSYQQMTSFSLYGGNLSYYLLDILAQRYEGKASITDPYGNMARYNYVNMEPLILPVWSDAYKVIAQCNLILMNTESNKGALTAQEYGIIRGEALAMRGFLHFELLRLFTPAYLDGANAAAPGIPYMDKFSIKQKDKLSIQAVLDLCEADLKAAESLLAVYPDIDQIAGNQGSTNADLFRMYRQNHLNYWAAKAVLARLYQYKGAKEQALKYALEVIDSKKFRFMLTQAELDVDPTSLSANLTFTPEHIFSLYVNGLKTNSDLYFKPAANGVPDNIDLVITRNKLNNLYEVQTPGYITDIRNPFAAKSLWTQVTTSAVYTKKYLVENTQNVRASLVPVIRLPEMYYIAAESAPDLNTAITYLNAVRTSRLLPALPVPATAADLDGAVMKEYQKEFYAEGQLWHYYKRKNFVSIPESVGNPMSVSKYVFPIPAAELEFVQ